MSLGGPARSACSVCARSWCAGRNLCICSQGGFASHRAAPRVLITSSGGGCPLQLVPAWPVINGCRHAHRLAATNVLRAPIVSPSEEPSQPAVPAPSVSLRLQRALGAGWSLGTGTIAPVPDMPSNGTGSVRSPVPPNRPHRSDRSCCAPLPWACLLPPCERPSAPSSDPPWAYPMRGHSAVFKDDPRRAFPAPWVVNVGGSVGGRPRPGVP